MQSAKRDLVSCRQLCKLVVVVSVCVSVFLDKLL